MEILTKCSLKFIFVGSEKLLTFHLLLYKIIRRRIIRFSENFLRILKIFVKVVMFPRQETRFCKIFILLRIITDFPLTCTRFLSFICPSGFGSNSFCSYFYNSMDCLQVRKVQCWIFLDQRASKSSYKVRKFLLRKS